MQPGIYDISNEAYHSGPGISKSGLWTIWNQTPAHYYAGLQEQTDTSDDAKDFGSAAHAAILEPEVFEEKFFCGPDVRRNTNVWKDAAAYAAQHGKTILKPSDYAAVERLRDQAAKHPILRALTTDADLEQSAYWIDEETGELCRVRPDAYSRKHKLIGDLKTTTSAAHDKWIRRAVDFGYHVQEPFYSDGWSLAGGGDVDGFVFVVVERDPPHLFAVYELDPDSVEEGRQIYRAALKIYADCRKTNSWPGYADTVQEMRLPKWAFRFVQPQLDAAE
ncbi:PD-(D/E)XK nuclease-like domain-containing protein [Microvirga sp. G4-2]|uniref:PD-(D/E)XK nuclease-like domain-containing protein n=1 Tax=Microvirga sp. G4-2 TaxID=3434467 RepID=UPI004044B4F8